MYKPQNFLVNFQVLTFHRFIYHLNQMPRAVQLSHPLIVNMNNFLKLYINCIEIRRITYWDT